MRAAYILVALLVLSPSIVMSLFIIGVLSREPTFVREQSSPEALHAYAIGVGGVQVRFHPRIWPAVIVTIGTVLWTIGMIWLLFVPR